MKKILTESRVLLALGAGGVGKTTSSIAMAIYAAQHGRRVGLISIDPAKRLASALGIPLGSELVQLNIPELIGKTGTIFAAMLDQKAVFDQMVRKYAVTAKVADLIMKNRLYQAASTNLGGPLEYLALSKLAMMVESKEFDLVIVDTPPDSHALDFLERPNVLNGFMESKVMSWLLKPFLMARRFGLGKLISAGEKLMGGIASITGVQALEALAEFLVLIQDVIAGFHRAGEQILGILKAPGTRFVLVTSPSSAAVRSVVAMGVELQRQTYRVGAIVINRCVPSDIAAEAMKFSDASNQPVAALCRRLESEKRSVEQLVKIATVHSASILKIPDLERDLQTIPGLQALVKAWYHDGGASHSESPR